MGRESGERETRIDGVREDRKWVDRRMDGKWIGRNGI